MMTVTPAAESNIVELLVDGKISNAELEDALTSLGAAIERYGKVRVLEHILSFKGMSLGSVWKELKFDFGHIRDISHAAVVSDVTWIGALTKTFSPLVKTEVRCFTEDEMDEARAWLRSSQ